MQCKYNIHIPDTFILIDPSSIHESVTRCVQQITDPIKGEGVPAKKCGRRNDGSRRYHEVLDFFVDVAP